MELTDPRAHAEGIRSLAVSDCRQIATRKTFHGMQNTHAQLSVRKFPKDAIDQSLPRTALNGTFYTADHLPKRDETLLDACPFCGASGSVTHRNWQRPALAKARLECPPDMQQHILAQPPAKHNHEQMPVPPSLQKFRQIVDEIFLYRIAVKPHEAQASHC